LVDPTFQVPKFDDEDENKDNSSTEPDTNVKRKGMELSSYHFVNLDNPPQTQHEVDKLS
jgi:hypothetical protein